MESNRQAKSQSLLNQFYGLILKRVHYSKRHWSILFSQLIIPFLIICFCFVTINSVSSQFRSNVKSLKLDIENVYGKTDGFYTLNSEAELYADKFKEVLLNKDVNVKKVDNLNTSILNYADSSMVDYFKHLIVSGSVSMTEDNLKFTAWFNGPPYHALPMSLLLMNSAILKSNFKTGDITLTNNPLPSASMHMLDSTSTAFASRIIANIFIPLALSFLAASFVFVPIHERASKAKLLQLMTGISAPLYWLAMFIWDFAFSIILCILLIIPFAIFSHPVFFAPHSEAIGKY